VPSFLPAAELSRAFYVEVVRPLVGGRPHSAALLGWGSDVLGYDTERSTDHGWGPRVLVFIDDEGTADDLHDAIAARLPESFGGLAGAVRMGWRRPTDHVTVTTVPPLAGGSARVDATAGMSTLDWLLTPQQQLLGVVGEVTHADEAGALAATRSGWARPSHAPSTTTGSPTAWRRRCAQTSA
jgi:hypothetical protein